MGDNQKKIISTKHPIAFRQIEFLPIRLNMKTKKHQTIQAKKCISNRYWAFLLISIVLMTISSCSHKDLTKVSPLAKEDGQKVVEAYENYDWETIVSICDTLMDEKDTMNLVIPYAEALAVVGNPQKSISILDKKLIYNPTDYYLYLTKGNVYYSMGEYDSAIICYEKVISMRPTYARAYMNAGQTYEYIGNKDKAIDNYLAAAQLFIDNNYIKEAYVYAERVLKIDSTNVEAKQLLLEIQSIIQD